MTTTTELCNNILFYSMRIQNKHTGKLSLIISICLWLWKQITLAETGEKRWSGYFEVLSMKKMLSSFYFSTFWGKNLWVWLCRTKLAACFQSAPWNNHKSRHPPCIILVLIFLSPTLAQGRGQSIYACHWHSILSLTEEENHLIAHYLFISNNYRPTRHITNCW